MEIFNLPKSTRVNKVVPKNSFDKYTNTKQKRDMTDLVQRIVWENKLSKETVNLDSEDIKEIQIFGIELKRKAVINDLLDMIDKAVPYHIIFVLNIGDAYYISTSSKHPHPTIQDTSVIDWTFRSEWIEGEVLPYKLTLVQSLDKTYLDFCKQLSGREVDPKIMMTALVSEQQEIQQLQKEIARLEARMRSCKQFKLKVELNMELNIKRNLLDTLLRK